MAVLATDNFNRADNADLGSSWDVMPGESPFKIVTNQVTPASLQSDCTETNNSVTWPNDQYSQVTFVLCTGDVVSGTGIGVSVRSSTSARTSYRIAAVGTSSDRTEIAKFVAGSYTSLATQGASWVPTDTLYVSAVGTTIQVKRNGTNLFSATDSAISSGRPGIIYSGESTTAVLDNWEGGDFASTFTPIMQRVYGVTTVRAAYH